MKSLFIQVKAVHVPSCGTVYFAVQDGSNF